MDEWNKKKREFLMQYYELKAQFDVEKYGEISKKRMQKVEELNKRILEKHTLLVKERLEKQDEIRRLKRGLELYLNIYDFLLIFIIIINFCLYFQDFSMKKSS